MLQTLQISNSASKVKKVPAQSSQVTLKSPTVKSPTVKSSSPAQRPMKLK